MIVKIMSIPQGFIARDYVNLTLMLVAYYHRDKGFDVRCSRGCVEFTGKIDDVCLSFATAYSRILDVVKAKKGIPCPKMHKNDRNVLSRMLNKLGLPKPSKDAKYIDVFQDVIKYFKQSLKDPKECKQFISELSTLKFTRSELLLGSTSSKETFAPLQPFKIEKYEYGKDFLDLSKSKMDVKTTPSWISLIAAGWILSFNGFVGGTLVFSMPPSYVVDSAICSGEYAQDILYSLGVNDPKEAFDVDKGYYATPLRIGSPANPIEAYHMLLALASPSLRNPSLVPLRIMRIGFDGRRFTMLEDVIIDLSRLKEFIESVSVSKMLIEALERLSRCAILSYSGTTSNYCKAMFGDNAVRMIKTLYNAIMGSYDPLYTIYMLSRLSPEPVEAKAYPYFRKPQIVNDLLKALISLSI